MKDKLQHPIVLVALLLILISIGYFFRDDLNPENIEIYLQQFGIWAPVAFVVLYALATVFFMPGSVLTITGGFIFGPIKGTLINLTGAMIGATCAFLIARYLARDWVADKSGGKLKKLVDGVEQEGWRFIAVVRLVPLLPFNLLNYALGLTPVSLLAYVLASAIFMLPGAAAYTYVGSLGRTALAGEVKLLVQQGLIAIGLIVILLVIPWVVKRLRQ